MRASRRVIVCVVGAAALLCAIGAWEARIQARQGTQGNAPLMADQVFHNIRVLKGVPVDSFFDAMGMFAASMGDDCTYCHSKEAVFRPEAFGDPTPRIQRARQMILMMNAINRTNFGGEPRVTCFTCHRGDYAPQNAPRLSLQYGVPEEEPNMLNFPPESGVDPDEIFDRYYAAIGGERALGAVTSLAARGTYMGFDTGFAEVPVDVYARAPNQRTWIVHMPTGDSYRVFDGRQGWFAGPDSPAPLVPLSSGNLDRARLEALMVFPTEIEEAYSEWKIGRTSIDGADVQILQGSNPGSDLLPVNFYFDNDTGLLVRWVRWNITPVGPVPTQLDYSDYREVNGVKVPFAWTASQTYMQMTIQLSDLQLNVPVDAARFEQPAPGAGRAAAAQVP